MKALAMLDHVMLWVARLAALLLFVLGFNATNNQIHDFGITLFSLYPIVFAVLVCVCVFTLKTGVSRLVLALFATCALVWTTSLFVMSLTTLDLSPTNLLYLIYCFFGATSMLWTSIRFTTKTPALNRVSPA